MLSWQAASVASANNTKPRSGANEARKGNYEHKPTEGRALAPDDRQDSGRAKTKS